MLSSRCGLIFGDCGVAGVDGEVADGGLDLVDALLGRYEFGGHAEEGDAAVGVLVEGVVAEWRADGDVVVGVLDDAEDCAGGGVLRLMCGFLDGGFHLVVVGGGLSECCRGDCCSHHEREDELLHGCLLLVLVVRHGQRYGMGVRCEMGNV